MFQWYSTVYCVTILGFGKKNECPSNRLPSMYVCLLIRSPWPYSLFIIGWWCSNPRTAAMWDTRLYPYFLVYYFPVKQLFWSSPPPSPPSNIRPVSLPCTFRPYPLSFLFLFPPLRPCLFSRPSPSSSVWSLGVRPEEVYNPPADGRPNVLSWFPVQIHVWRFVTPPPVRLVVLGLGVGGGAKETEPPAMVLSSSTRRKASLNIY